MPMSMPGIIAKLAIIFVNGYVYVINQKQVRLGIAPITDAS